MHLRALLSGEVRKPVRCVCCASLPSERPLYECVQVLRAPWVSCLPCAASPPDRLPQPCHHVPRVRIRIMPDFGGAYMWSYGGPAEPLVQGQFPDIPGIRALEAAFIAWQCWFERDCDSGHDPRFPWARFHARGLALAKRLAALLAPRGIEVYYERPYEDPDGRNVPPMRIES